MNNSYIEKVIQGYKDLTPIAQVGAVIEVSIVVLLILTLIF